MSSEAMVQERNQLHRWIDQLPPKRLDLVYRLVEELVEDTRDDTEYLLRSAKMRERLLLARESDEAIPVEAVREKLGI